MSSAVSRRRTGGLCAAIALIACPVAARGQDMATGQTPAEPVPPAVPLDPGSPMAPLPGLGVEWPDLATPDAPLAELPTTPGQSATPSPPPAAKAGTRAIQAEGEQRYTLILQGIDGIRADDLRERFDSLSSLKQGEGKPANVAQIDRRAREDAETLRALLRAYGYYDAEVDPHVAPIATPGDEGRLAVTLAAEPGALYHFTALTFDGLAATGKDRPALVTAFGVRDGDPVNADRVTAGAAALKAALGDRGYAFAKVGQPQVTVDHDAHSATLALAIDPGRAMRFGGYVMMGRHVFGPGHLQRISRLRPGQLYNASRLDDLRRALIQTGLVSTVTLTPVHTADPDVVDVQAELGRAPPRTIAATFGYGTGEGASVEVSWEDRNLIPPEGDVTFRGLAGTQEQLFSTTLRRGNFRSRDQVLTAQIALDHQNRPAYDAKTITVSGGIARETNIIWQKKWTWSYQLELIGSDERDVIAATGAPRRRTYVIVAAPLTLAYDGTDDLLNPSTGYRLSAQATPSESLHNNTFTYLKMQFDGSYYRPIGKHVVLAGRVRLGAIEGGDRDEIAPTQRFYSGGGGSVRGYGYQDIGPRDIDNTPIGGTSLAEFGTEARIRFGNFGIVPFFDGGNLYTSPLPHFTGFRYGAGLGARYYTSFGPVRIDVGTPINPQRGDARVTVYVSLGQAF